MTEVNLAKHNILVCGDIMLDEYVSGSIDRISPEAPVPVVNANDVRYCLGGAANVALNLKSLGCDVTLVGIIGNDASADKIINLLNVSGITHNIIRLDKATICKKRVMTNSGHVIRLDYEEKITATEAASIEEIYSKHCEISKTVILSDYNKGTLSAVNSLITIAKKHNNTVIVDPKQNDFALYRGCDLLTPNQKELMAMLNLTKSSSWQQKLHDTMQRYDIKHVVFTQGSKGMTLISQQDVEYHLNACEVEVFDVTGAGDTVVAVLASLMTHDFSIKRAMYYANLAAGFVVAKKGTASVTFTDLFPQKMNVSANDTQKVTLANIAVAKEQGHRIVMTNGCFDVLHAGHVSYLNKAKQMADKLVVAVNTDASVTQLKGSSRPVNTLKHRMYLLESLQCVDYVISFSEETPVNVISLVNPDVLVKGKDYKISEIVGADYVIAQGGEVSTIELEPGLSTTSILEKLTQTEIS